MKSKSFFRKYMIRLQSSYAGKVLFSAMAIVLLSSFGSSPPKITVDHLRCEMLVDPIGIDLAKPRLSWEISGDQRGIRQTAYQVLVASSSEKLAANEGDLWNSGKVLSDQSIHVYYNGVPLASRTTCYWKIKIWTDTDEHPWSEPACWTMGLNRNDWQAKWIGLDRAFPWDSADNKFSRLSARYFRKEFAVNKIVKRAMAYISGLGLYELYINSQRIGDQVLAPAPTDYTESVLYNTFDVTHIIKSGNNAVAVVLGNGRYFTMRQAYKPQKIHTFGYPKMLLQVEIEYTDGERQTIVSDGTWKVTADGPIRTNNEYDGEAYDATKELPGWNAAGFNDHAWLKAEEVEEPGGKVRAQINENMKVMETIKPVSIKEIAPGKYILDLGQNMVGWLKMKVTGKRNDKVTLRFAETLQTNGELYTENLRDARVTDVYTLKGGEEETWEPSFVYHGFRYIEVTGFPGKPEIGSFEGRVVYDAISTTGTFETSDATLNSIYKNAYWGIRGNYKGMPLDCPQRNERQPWLGDRATGSYGESFIFDNAKLYAKWLDDIEESQTAEGRIPDVAPNFWFYYKDNMTWPGTYLMVANMLYHQFGDTHAIAHHYGSMKQWLIFMRARYMDDDYIITKDSYGDWCVPPESPELIHARDPSRKTDGALIATAYHYYFLGMMEQFATLLQKPKDAAEFAALSLEVKKAFNKRFFDPSTAQYGNGTVTANILPLRFGMVPEEAKEKVFGNIVDKIMNASKGHISTGVIGTQWLMRTLTANNRPDIALRIATNRDYPSWGYMVEQGATTIWELWNGNTANPAMNSHNHVMLLGDLIVWYYENLAGIRSDAAYPGFGQLEMKPSVEGLDFVKASYHSVHGLIKSEWRKKNDRFTWNIAVPGNTKAVVYIPARSAASVMEGGKKVSSANGIKFLRMEKDRAVFEVGSGEYVFTSSL